MRWKVRLLRIKSRASITSSIGSSIYNELAEELEPDSRLSESQRRIQLLSNGSRVKPNFIPVKISFKIEADNAQTDLASPHFSERLYRDFILKSLTFHLTPNNQICGLHFGFFHRQQRVDFEGCLHGRFGSKNKILAFDNGDFLTMVHFQGGENGLNWLKLFTKRASLEVGEQLKESRSPGVRYFPQEVKLCKFFTNFNARSGNLAQLRFMYVRTIFY